jgi:hypothetical protein
MAGSRFGRRYDKTKLTAPVLLDAEVLEILAHAVGQNGAPAQAYRQLLARRGRGEDVVCIVDERDLFVIPRAELPIGLAHGADE